MPSIADRLTTWWKQTGALTRAALAAGLLALVAGAGFQLSRSEPAPQAALYTRLSAADAGEVVDQLRQRKIPFQLADGGSTVLVPSNAVYELRLDMAAAGLPRGGGVGFEIFDNNSMMMTNFTQHVNYTRALQGELARTIGEMPEVASARVHLALPKDSLFSRERREPSASVYVKLHAGRTLSKRQVAGVTHLVTTGVEGLSAERVTVLDGDGRLLTAPPEDGSAGSGRLLAMVGDYEARLEQRVVELLEPVVGVGRVVAKVAVDMDMSRVRATEESFDADGVVIKSERKSTEASERNSAAPAVAAAAGVQGNLVQGAPAEAPAVAANGSNQNRATSQVDYAVPRVVREIEQPSGAVKRLSVAVLIDQPEGAAAGATDAPNGVRIEGAAVQAGTGAVGELIKRAVGFSESRGDRLEVMLAPFFHAPEVAEAPPPVPEASPSAMYGLIGAALALVAAGVGLALWTRRKRRLVALLDEQKARAEALLGDNGPAPDPMTLLRDSIRQAARTDPKATARLLKEWIAA